MTIKLICDIFVGIVGVVFESFIIILIISEWKRWKRQKALEKSTPTDNHVEWSLTNSIAQNPDILIICANKRLQSIGEIPIANTSPYQKPTNSLLH